MKYCYLKEMTKDIQEYINENFTTVEQLLALEDREEWENTLYDALWVEDSVTGNASGSYTFSRYKAKEYVIDNIDLLSEAVQEFCIESELVREKFLNEDWEYFDTIIRCYLLSAAVCDAVGKIADYLNTILPIAEIRNNEKAENQKAKKLLASIPKQETSS